MLEQAVGIACLGWCVTVAVVTTIGTVQIYRHYSRPPRKPVSSYLAPNHVPHVTIIRPCKGVEPFLYECLASTYHQDYPKTCVSYHYCVASKSDGAYPILERLVKDYPRHDTRIYIEEEDPVVQGHDGTDFGPNPKIRNMSRAYREARGDVIWILDCNIWVGYGALGRMVDKLCGFNNDSNIGQNAQTQRPYKLVAHLPVCVDVDNLKGGNLRHRSASASATDDASTIPLISSTISLSEPSSALTGSMLETSFLSTAHAKMYVAINSVSIAPCINGKSTMFRKSHLNHLTHDQGIDHFSHNICEDHLIGDLLWKSTIPPTLGFDRDAINEGADEIKKSNPRGLNYRNHGLAVGDLAIQPMAKMSVASYIARRVRWLRVRKFTVMLATLVEPGTESLLCCVMGAYAVTTVKPLKSTFGSTWSAMAMWFSIFIIYWSVADWFVSGIIQGMGSVETTDNVSLSSRTPAEDIAVPPFAKATNRKYSKWFLAWAGREGLALSIWTWAIWGGTTVTWRERKFWVGMDMRVHEVLPHSRNAAAGSTSNTGGHEEGNGNAGGSNGSYHDLATSPHNGHMSTKAGKSA